MADVVKSLAHWGSSRIIGRGLFALAGRGSIAHIKLGDGESYVAHPSNVVAYSMNRAPPLPYRLKASSFRLQIPNLGLPGLIPETKFVRVARESWTWRTLIRVLHSLRTWFRRSIWGDRLFLEFYGPATILLQTRAVKLNDVLTSRDINEIAESPAGSVQKGLLTQANKDVSDVSEPSKGLQAAKTKPPQMSTASIGPDGKIIFTKASSQSSNPKA
ncbi:MAG: hypothetical protein Q9181_000365 [Wetmoreana brouardii]